MSEPLRIALVGMGKIAHDQHLPAIAGNPDFELAAIVSRHGERIGDLPAFASVESLADSGIRIDAVAICTPPQVRRHIAQFAIGRGWHVFLEKPPAATLAEAAMLRDRAEAMGVSLFASWHSRFAAQVAPAREWLAGKRLLAATIHWAEDVRQWHPGQDWIFEPGGFGVFDPAINALSIATWILPHPFFVEGAVVEIPENRAAPIAAQVDFRDAQDSGIAANFTFLQQGRQSWEIVAQTDGGTLALADGGAALAINGEASPSPADDLHGEYAGLYRRFAELVRTGTSEMDVAPLRLVADVMLRARVRTVERFDW